MRQDDGAGPDPRLQECHGERDYERSSGRWRQGEIHVMLGDMVTVRMTETELAQDLHAVLEGVLRGNEVIVERDNHEPVAVIRSPVRSGRPILEILQEAQERGSVVTLDDDFGRDLEEIISGSQKTWNPPSWD